MYFADLYTAMVRACSAAASPEAVQTRSRNCPTFTSSLSSVKTSATSGDPVGISRSAYTNARSPMRMAAPSPKRRGVAEPLTGSVAFGVGDVEAGLAVAPHGAVHDVVVDEGHEVQELDRSAGVDHATVVRIAACSHETPVAERRSEALAGTRQGPQRRHRIARARASTAAHRACSSARSVSMREETRAPMRASDGGGSIGTRSG